MQKIKNKKIDENKLIKILDLFHICGILHTQATQQQREKKMKNFTVKEAKQVVSLINKGVEKVRVSEWYCDEDGFCSAYVVDFKNSTVSVNEDSGCFWINGFRISKY